MLPEDDKIKTSRRKGGSDGVTVSGIDNCLIKFHAAVIRSPVTI